MYHDSDSSWLSEGFEYRNQICWQLGLSCRKTIHGMTSSWFLSWIHNHALRSRSYPLSYPRLKGLLPPPLSCTSTYLSHRHLPSWLMIHIHFSDVVISVSLMCTIHLPCVLTTKLSSLLCCDRSHCNHRGRNQHSNHIAQPSDPFSPLVIYICMVDLTL